MANDNSINISVKLKDLDSVKSGILYSATLFLSSVL